MEVTIFSRDTIKPHISQTQPPQNLCLFDQLTPTTYPQVVLFYSTNQNPNFNVTKTLTNLKKSLSQTLTIFYPFSGRIKDNLFIADFDAGVPYAEARADLRMSEYFSHINKDIESLSKLVPYPAFCRETNTLGPLLAVQVTLFSCGGIAVGTSSCHKKTDGSSLSHLLRTWASIFSQSPHKTVPDPPNHAEPGSIFPPLTKVPQNAISLMEQLWFQKSRYATRRFVFDSRAVEGLRALARSESVPAPTRNEAVSCFIWKHAMSASKSVSESSKTSIAAHAVNIRPRMKSRAHQLGPGTGNLFWWAAVATNSHDREPGAAELGRLVAMTRETLNAFNESYLETMVGRDGFEPVSEFLSQLEAMLSLEAEKPDILGFTNWKGFFNEVDFGWGAPVWVSAHGKVGDEFRNLVVLMDRPGTHGKEIEAFVTLEHTQMCVLEKDPEFLAFATSNSEIESPLIDINPRL